MSYQIQSSLKRPTIFVSLSSVQETVDLLSTVVATYKKQGFQISLSLGLEMRKPTSLRQNLPDLPTPWEEIIKVKIVKDVSNVLFSC